MVSGVETEADESEAVLVELGERGVERVHEQGLSKSVDDWRTVFLARRDNRSACKEYGDRRCRGGKSQVAEVGS